MNSQWHLSMAIMEIRSLRRVVDSPGSSPDSVQSVQNELDVTTDRLREMTERVDATLDEMRLIKSQNDINKEKADQDFEVLERG
jgi:hypothetical protein